MSKKMIYNPVTNKYYPVRNKIPKKGHIKGLWNFNNTDSVMCQPCLGMGIISGERIHPPKMLLLKCFFENRHYNPYIHINCPYCGGTGMVKNVKVSGVDVKDGR